MSQKTQKSSRDKKKAAARNNKAKIKREKEVAKREKEKEKIKKKLAANRKGPGGAGGGTMAGSSAMLDAFSVGGTSKKSAGSDGLQKQGRGGLSGNMKGGVNAKGWGDEAFDEQTKAGMQQKEIMAANAKAAKYKEYEEPGAEDGARQRKKAPFQESAGASGKGSLFMGGKSAFNNSVKQSGKID